MNSHVVNKGMKEIINLIVLNNFSEQPEKMQLLKEMRERGEQLEMNHDFQLRYLEGYLRMTSDRNKPPIFTIYPETRENLMMTYKANALRNAFVAWHDDNDDINVNGSVLLNLCKFDDFLHINLPALSSLRQDIKQWCVFSSEAPFKSDSYPWVHILTDIIDDALSFYEKELSAT